MRNELYHKTHGRVYFIEDVNQHMVRVLLHTKIRLPEQGYVPSLVVGRSALFEGRDIPKPLAVKFLPLARGMARRYVGLMDWEECISEATTALVRAAKDYDGDVGSFQAYATVVIRNALNDASDRARKVHKAKVDLMAEMVTTHKRNGAPILDDYTSPQEHKTLLKDVRKIIKQLPARQAQVLQLYITNNLSQTEISDITGLDQSNVSRNLSNAIKALQKNMEEYEKKFVG